MRSWLYYMVFVSLFGGCGIPRAHHDPAVKPYIKSFLKTFGGDTRFLEVRIVELPSRLAGKCEGGKVFLNAAYWALASDIRKAALVWHELGHCIKGWEHDSNLDKTGCPVSFMYPSTLSEGCLAKLPYWR